MNSEKDLIGDYLGISPDNAEPDYDNGKWFRLTFYGANLKSEVICTEDESFVDNNPSVVKDLKSKGYKYYYCDQRIDGIWKAQAPFLWAVAL